MSEMEIVKMKICQNCCAPLDDCNCTWMQLASGRAFFPFAPRVEDIQIEDIAHALALQNRYAGHTSYPMSVAHHCLMVSRIVEEHRDLPALSTGCSSIDSGLSLAALLHDAAEAYLVDLPRPVKEAPGFADGYKALERKLESAVEERFGLSSGVLNDPRVKRADDMALAHEANALGMLDRAPRNWRLHAPPDCLDHVTWHARDRYGSKLFRLCPLEPASWQDVKVAFLAEFQRLTGGR